MDTPPMPSLHTFQAAMPMAQMSSFAPALQPQHAGQPTDTTDRARAYKSRNKRPCDFCRYKKAACHLDSQPPCELCIRYNKECTFVESPAKRRRPNESSDSSHAKDSSINTYTSHERNGSLSSHNGAFINGHVNGGIDMHHELIGWENGMPPFQMSMGLGSELGAPDFALDPSFYQEPAYHEPSYPEAALGFDAFDPLSASTTIGPPESTLPSVHHRGSIDTIASPHSSTSQLPASLILPFDSTSGEPSLELQSSSNSQIVGLSGEFDPYLLSRYRYDACNETGSQSVRIRKMNGGAGLTDSVPTFFTIQHNALVSKAQPTENFDTLRIYRHEVEEKVGDEVGRRLIQLFYRYIQPYFPVLGSEYLSRSRDDEGTREPSSVPTCLLAAIYGHALAFCPWDDKLCVEVYTPPCTDTLFRIAWLAASVEFHTPSLAVLQTLLLLIQRRPTNKHVSDTPFKGVIMAAAISVAQSLGLNRDPSNWPLPQWEIKQRRRLAWAVYIQDKWLALNSGKSSLLQADDWDVSPLTEDDFVEVDRGTDALEPSPATSGLHFMKLRELTEIVDDILRNLFSIKSTKALQHSLERTLDVAKPLRLRLTEWFQALPIGLIPQPKSQSPSNSHPVSRMHELDGNGSLQLAYITAKIELFRAMLRPRCTDSNATALSALRTGAIAVAKEVFDFLDGLHSRELEAFWASYARTNFTIASSFMLLLFVTSPNVPDAKECLNLLLSWRALLRVKSRSCDLLNLSLLRLDGVWVAGIDRLIELSPAAAQAWNESGQGKG